MLSTVKNCDFPSKHKANSRRFRISCNDGNFFLNDGNCRTERVKSLPFYGPKSKLRHSVPSFLSLRFIFGIDGSLVRVFFSDLSFFACVSFVFTNSDNRARFVYQLSSIAFITKLFRCLMTNYSRHEWISFELMSRQDEWKMRWTLELNLWGRAVGVSEEMTSKRNFNDFSLLNWNYWFSLYNFERFEPEVS